MLASTVVFCSSEHQRFPAAELNRVAGIAPPAKRGWQSDAQAKFPVEMVLCFDGIVELAQLQILSHECKIPTKVEVFVGVLDNQPIKPFQQSNFKKLGFVTYVDNERTQYRSREMKTVHLSSVATAYLKLLIHKPHRNALNLYDQVGILSVNCSGRIVQRMVAQESRVPQHHAGRILPEIREVRGPQPSLLSTPWGEESMHSESPAMTEYQMPPPMPPMRRKAAPWAAVISDPVLSRLPRHPTLVDFQDYYEKKSKELALRKGHAISTEDFDAAKIAKEQLTLLDAAALKIFELEFVKMQAIVDEDFDAAKRAKVQIDETLHGAYTGQPVPLPPAQSVPQGKSRKRKPSQLVDEYQPETHESGMQGVKDSNTPRASFDDMPVNSKYAKMMAEAAHEHLQQRKSSEAVDDSPRHDQATKEPDSSDEGSEEEADDPEAPNNDESGDGADHEPGETSPNAAQGREFDLQTLAEWERDLFTAIHEEAGKDQEAPAEIIRSSEVHEYLAVLGPYTTACLFSKRWKLRESVLRVLANTSLRVFRNSTPQQVVVLLLKYCDLKNFGILDPVPNVHAATCEFLQKLLEGHLEDVLPISVHVPLFHLLPRLILRAGDPAQKVREEALAVILSIANNISAERVAQAVLADPVDQDKRRVLPQNHRIHIARLVVLQQLITVNRIGTHVDALMTKLLVPCLNHNHNDVRDQAVTVTGLLDPNDVAKHLSLVVNPVTRAALREKLSLPSVESEKKRPAIPPAIDINNPMNVPGGRRHKVQSLHKS